MLFRSNFRSLIFKRENAVRRWCRTAGDFDLLMARITTHPPRESSDAAVNRWSEIGLPHASTIRLTKLITIDHRLVHHKIGRLHSDDGRAVAQAMKQLTASIMSQLPGCETAKP